MTADLDQIDRAILSTLQKDSRLSMAELGEKVGLSSSACHRRVLQLQTAGIIEGYAARLNAKSLGLDLHFIVDVSLHSQAEEDLETFERAAGNNTSVLECYLMAGQADFSLRVSARDTAHYEEVHRQIAHMPGVTRIESKLILRTVKKWMGYKV
jgi:Lrp/AsnC family transcriptional regulator, leucine-responsive regulatory protein